MKRSQFILRLAAENKFAFISDTVDVVQIPDNTRDSHVSQESHSTLLSISSPWQSPKQDSNLQNYKEKWIGCTVTDEEPLLKLSYEDCLETTMQCKHKNAFTRPSTNMELAQPQENGNHSCASSTTITSSHNKFVNIISDVILKPGRSVETTFAQYVSDLDYTVPIDNSVYNFYDKECGQLDLQTENKDPSAAEVSENSKNITLLASLTSQQKFIENSPNFVTTMENTDNFYIWSDYKENRQIIPLENQLVTDPSTFPLELDNILASDTDDVYESSGDEYVPSPNDEEDCDRSSSDSGSEMSVGDVHRTYSKNVLKENITILNMDQRGQTYNKDTLQWNYNCFDPETNTLGTKLTKQIKSTEKANTDNYPETSLVMNQRYIRKQSARERPTICPLCYEDVITHFPRHLSRHHPKDPEVERMLSLKPNSKERLELVSAFRKRGYFILKTEKDISHPVRSSKDSDTNHFVCTFCLGLYNKKSLYRHVKVCKSKPHDVTNSGKNCLSKSQTFMASKNHEFLRTSRLKKEVFEIMRADSVSYIAKSDPLICLYGDVLLAKHKRQQIVTLVSNKIREMAKILLAIRSMHDNITGLFDVLKPEMFATLVAAAKLVSGYNEIEKNFRAPSLALHMGTNLKTVCNIAFKIVIEKKQIPNISWENRDEKKSDIKDLKKLIEAHWCNEISSLALKDLKERQWQKPNQLPISEDILLFKKYIEEISENAHESLQKGVNVKDNYKKLTECVLAQTIMFNRKRVGDVQYLKIETYERENCSTVQKAFSESLTDVEKILCAQFKRVITDGKGSKPVPILFSKRTQGYIKSLLKVRKSTNIVPESNSYLFASPGVKNKWIRGDYIIRMLAKKCGAKHPVLLTSTKFRKHIATTLQLMNMGADEMEQVATFMGHTKKTHAQFYRLPQDIYQTSKVVKVLLLLEEGKGKEFRGKNLEEINLDKDYFNPDTSDKEDKYEVGIAPKKRKRQFNGDTDITKEMGEQTEEVCRIDEIGRNIAKKKARAYNIKELREKPTKIQTKDETIGGNKDEIKERNNIPDLNKKTTDIQIKDEDTSRLKPIAGRSRWTPPEKKLVENYFWKHIKNRITPKKYECDQFLSIYGDKIEKKDWVKIKTFVYNIFRQK